MDEVAGAFDGAVHVRLGGEVQNVGDGMVANDAGDDLLIAEVHLLEAVFLILGNGGDIFQTPGVGEAVEVDDVCDFGLADDVFKHMGADEAATAGD